MKRKKFAMILLSALSFAALLINTVTPTPIAIINQKQLPQTLLVGGQAFGVKFYTQGVMVVDMTPFETEEGMRNPAKQAGLRVGDVIVSIDSQIVSTNKDISELVEDGNGKSLRIEYSRSGKIHTLTVTPLYSTVQKAYKLGLWVRDSTAGVGTITYIDPHNRRFGALGHGISDVDTGQLMPLSDGEVLQAYIGSVVAGQKGKPGQLKGAFVEDARYGSLDINSPQGVFGNITGNALLSNEEFPVATAEQVHVGAATIRSTVDGLTCQEYDIQIEKIDLKNNDTKNYVIRIVDEDLLALTGGIVQGMSGSPILQDGRIVGALTHVLIGDPTTGYGIFIGNMLNADTLS